MSSVGNVKEADWVSVWAKLMLALFCLFLVLFGAYTGRLALCEPDTAFLAAGGRWIVEHGHLASTDPFSYTYAMVSGNPLIPHMWLTEVVFYSAIRCFGLPGLLITVAILLALSFVIIPLTILEKTELSRITSFMICALVLFAICPRISARPELFSYLIYAMWLQRLLVLEARRPPELRSTWLSVAVFTLSMVLWCNLHSGFMSGLTLLIVWFALSFAEYVFLKKTPSTAMLTSLIAAPFCFLASLCNPSGWKLCPYLLSFFSSPVNLASNEMKGLDLSSLTNLNFCAFFSLIIISFCLCLSKWRHSTVREIGFKSPAFIVMAIIVGFGSQRMVPFACFLLLTALSLALTKKIDDSVTSASIEPSAPILLVDKKIDALLCSHRRSWAAFQCLMVMIGVALFSLFFPLQLPAESNVFHTPIKAMQFLEKNPQSGRLFNDAHFGAAMMWNMRSCPPLFMDPRFDIYDIEIVCRYSNIINGDQGWQANLDRFNIKWIFLPTTCTLVKKLENSNDWATIYQDRYAIIFRRRD